MKKLIELYFSSLKRTLLFWLLAVSILPFVGVAWYGYTQTAQSVDTMQRNKLTQRATLNVATVSDRFYQAARDLKIWSQLRSPLEVIQIFEQNFNQSGQSLADFVRSAKYNENIKVQRNTIEQNLAKNYNYVYDLLLIDPNGNIVYSVAHQSDLGTNLQNGPYSKTRFAQAYRMSLADGKAHFSDLERYAPSGGIIAGFITQPIRDHSGKMVGLMALQLKMDVLFGSMQAQSKDMDHYIVGVDGLLRTPIDQNGETVLGEYRSVDLLGVRWAHISEMDKNVALAQSDKLLIAMGIFTLIGAFAVVFAAIVIARRIVKPIETLSKASQAYMSELKEQKYALDAHSIVAITDLTGRITSANSKFEEISGYNRDEIIGKNHRILNSGFHSRGFWSEMYRTVNGGSVWHAEVCNKAKNESLYWVDTTIVPFIGEDGKPESYIVIRTDITERKKIEKELIGAKEAAESSMRAKAEFLATMSHEIRTPVNGVIGMLELLSHSNLDETQRHQVRVANNSANSLLVIINEILDFSKVEAGKMELERIEFNMHDELGELIEAITPRAHEKGLELILDTTRLARSSVITDPGRLRQILTNLITNAIKFTHKGQVLVRVDLEEVDAHHGRLHIDVSDSGIGIAPDKIDKLFEPFSQADSSTTRKYGGTGLGLTIVKKLCELMNGTICITSVENEGSIFHVDIEVGLGEKTSLSIPSVSVEGKAILGVDDNETNREVISEVIWPSNTRVLLVEDNPTNQIVALGVLGIIGLEADVASNGLEALKSIQLAPESAPYTIILMDCQMPQMDGYAASTAIRQGDAGDAYREIPIIAMTANAMSGDREKCLMSGMSDYVSKPINIEILKATLMKWMGGKISAASDAVPEEETQELKVWDEADALGRLGGRKELLRKIMQSFLDESAGLMSALDEAIATGDFPHVQLHAHSIKGSSSNVSGEQVRVLAKSIEFAAKNMDIHGINEGYKTLKIAMNELCDVFKKELSRDEMDGVK